MRREGVLLFQGWSITAGKRKHHQGCADTGLDPERGSGTGGQKCAVP